jgi:CoA:oxalate CoA-transferase
MNATSASAAPKNPRPLAGVRVLDLTLFLSGPYGTQILGDMGAEVIKIEPGGGDQTRFLPPNFVADDSAYFLSVNRNKQSLVLDYKTEEGRRLLEDLVRESDVLIENLRTGNLERHGISYARMAEINPRLVWCSISAFGQEGPSAQRPAYDMIIQALSGGMSMTGEEGGIPVRAAIPLGDIAAGMYAVIGISGAIAGRERTGRGQYIDISMLDCQIAMLSYQAAYYLHSGKVPGPQGRGHESIPTYRSFTAGDGVDFVICANTDRMWQSLCHVVGRDDMGRDPRMKTRRQRYKERQEIWDTLNEIFLQKPAAAWVELLHAAEVPVALVNTVDKALSEPQVQHRKMVVEMAGRNGKRVRVAGDPIKIPTATDTEYHYPPELGGDTRRILKRILKLSDIDVDALVQRAVVAEPPESGVQ